LKVYKKMNEKKETITTAGKFMAHDKQGVPVMLEWQKTTFFAPEFAALMKEVWPIARDAYTPVELDFLRAFPQVVGVEDYFKPFEPLFKDGIAAVDWLAVERVMQDLLKTHFIFDTSTWSAEVMAMFAKDVFYVVTVKDQCTNELLGFRTLMQRANYPHGTIKGISLAIDPKHQRRGLATLLMGSIFRIIPDIKRTFMCTRVTNEKMQHACKGWGFTLDEHPILDHAFNKEHWIFLEYKADQVDTLQKVAAGMVGIFWGARCSTPKIEVSKQYALIDERIEISISNLAAQETITLEALCRDKDNNTWTSHATFEADSNGIVTLAKQAPISGTYSGIDPMGLFWSMASPNKETPIFFANDDNDVHDVILSVYSGKKLRTQTILHRLLVSAEVERISIRENGIIGTFFYPKNLQHGPGIITIPGSNGGISERISKLLASHGYAVLALGYFGLGGLPKTLESIHLEYFQKAMLWFKKQPQVNANRVALFGQSLGGELVLILASTFPKEVAAVIAGVPAGIVYGGFPHLDKPCWLYKNAPLPFIPLYPCDNPTPNTKEILNAVKEGKIPYHAGSYEDPFDYSPVFLLGMEVFHQRVEVATIPVENMTCPLLLLSGETDKVWPATLYSNLVMKRLDEKKSPIKRKHKHFANAGHCFLFPYSPFMPIASQPIFYPEEQQWTSFGGTAKGNARANKEAWQEVLRFLEETLST
jgi:dienelactone hydrolase/RimJ/RimL family protein N-acetyltransferase